MIASTIVKDLPSGTELLENQVAGHTFQIGTDEIGEYFYIKSFIIPCPICFYCLNLSFRVGMLKDQHDGSVMKAAVKPMCGIREIEFYEQLQKNCSHNPHMDILRELVPEYRGTVKCLFREKFIDFIKLADITHGMAEPCVIDIKIGKRTWDPFASAEKHKAEEQKYQACKRNLGFCIPGFQVYDIKSGRIKRYGKEYGKKLTPETVKDGELFPLTVDSYKILFKFSTLYMIAALKIYLNAETGLCRSLLMKFLSTLWTIQTWARSQTSLRLYSSSLLLVYDARVLKNQLLFSRSSSNSLATSPNGSLSPVSMDGSNSGKLVSNPYSNWPLQHYGHVNGNGVNGITGHTSGDGKSASSIGTGETIQLYKKLQRSHSAHNNYDEVSHSNTVGCFVCFEYLSVLHSNNLNLFFLSFFLFQ